MPLTLLVVIRGAISFITLLIIARVLGKQQLGQLTFFEYITGITIGSFASSMTVDLNSRVWLHWVGLCTWAGLAFLTQVLALRSRNVASFLGGDPVLIIRHGRILEENMRQNRYRFEELFMQLRQQGVFDLHEVEFAILETTGQLSVMTRNAGRGRPLRLPVIVVQEGEVLEEALSGVGRDRAWLEGELNRRGVGSLADVTVAVVDPEGKLYVDTYKRTDS